MHLFVRIRWMGNVRRIILLNSFAVLFVVVQAKHVDPTEKMKCTKHDSRKVYPYCMMFRGTLWCDQSGYERMPTVKEINDHLIDNDCRSATVLNINDSCLTDIEKREMQEFRHVTMLNIASNRMTILHGEVFYDNKELRHFNAPENKISRVEKDAFKGLGKLESLNLAHNKIEELKVGTFDHTSNLEELCFDDNRLSVIEDKLFTSLSRLKALRMRGNRISQIHQYAFRGVRSLTHLHLDGNKLRHVTEYTFQYLGNLEVLTISHNGFKDWPASYGQILVNVRTLDLGHNVLTKLSPNHLSNMTKLQNLKLNGNSLAAVDAELFQTTPSLVYLDMSDNDLSDIPGDAFSQLCHLNHLFLHKNAMKTPRKQWWERFRDDETVKNVSLSGNDWKCDCQAKEYWDFLQDLTPQNKLLQLMDIECEWPNKHRGRNLSGLTEADFEGCEKLPQTAKKNAVAKKCEEVSFQTQLALRPFQMQVVTSQVPQTASQSNMRSKAPSQEIPIIICLLLSAAMILLLILVWYCRATARRGIRNLHVDKSWVRHNRLDEEYGGKPVM